jgi:hypothetical protein
MFWLPEDSVEVVNLSTPELRVTVVSVVVPSMKVTVPVSVPPNCAAPLVEKVTDCPNFHGFSEEASMVVVFARLHREGQASKPASPST